MAGWDWQVSAPVSSLRGAATTQGGGRAPPAALHLLCTVEGGGPVDGPGMAAQDAPVHTWLLQPRRTVWVPQEGCRDPSEGQTGHVLRREGWSSETGFESFTRVQVVHCGR